MDWKDIEPGRARELHQSRELVTALTRESLEDKESTSLKALQMKSSRNARRLQGGGPANSGGDRRRAEGRGPRPGQQDRIAPRSSWRTSRHGRRRQAEGQDRRPQGPGRQPPARPAPPQHAARPLQDRTTRLPIPPATAPLAQRLARFAK